MVHVRKCPLSIGRGRPITDFYKDSKPQIYCMGWTDSHDGEPLEECVKCADWFRGDVRRSIFKTRGKTE